MRGRIRTGPDFAFEVAIAGGEEGLVAGIDEAGRGPLAGPVVAAAVILPAGADIPHLDDGKKLSPARREQVCGLVQATALAWAVRVVEVDYIDRYGILPATYLAMRLALGALKPSPSYLLVDGGILPGVDLPQWGVIRGDGLCCSVAAASVLAKVYRDRLMVELDRRCPAYGFAIHKGYATRLHRQALARMGPSPYHRLSFLSGFREGCCTGERGRDGT
ncbi:MAG TPA: ribonuclease HII [Firmicutes bacterium]|nr:ribonuclease HII [Bacillota bacterium]